MKPKPRRTEPKYRQVRRASTTNWDIIQLAAGYWDVATHLEEMTEGLAIHNNQRRVDGALVIKCKQQARGLGYHLDPPNPKAFSTKELTDILYEQGKTIQKQKADKEARQARLNDLPDVHFS